MPEFRGNRIRIEGVPDNRLDELLDVIGEIAIEHRLSLTVEPLTSTTQERDFNPGNYNPELVSYLKDSNGAHIPILPKHKLEEYAKQYHHTQVLSSKYTSLGLFLVERLASHIGQLHWSSARSKPEGAYTYAGILRADTLPHLLESIHTNSEPFPFVDHEVNFLEACAADLKLDPQKL